jgi:ankyrin repeat protein
LVELGADVNQGMQDADDCTPLLHAAKVGNVAVVRYLVEAGAGIEAVGVLSDTALLVSASYGRFGAMKYLLEEAGANMDHVNAVGESVWDMLTEHLREVAGEDDNEVEADAAALTSLLRVMVLRDALPPTLVAHLSPEHARVAQKGARLRARLPAYHV